MHPECFTKNDADPRKRKRTTPMQVLALGMPRTGTASVHAALTMLGYETYHGFRASARTRDYELWNPAYETKFLNTPSEACIEVNGTFFDKVLGDMNAVTDMPAVSFSEELIIAYPDAKVILVERDIETWYKSFEQVFIQFYEAPIWPVVARVNPSMVGHMYSFITNGVARCHFGANNGREFRSHAREAYQRHYATVRSLLQQRGEAESRLLEFDLKDGWKPLCEFLGKDAPHVPFPHVNETAMIQAKIQVMLVYGLKSGVQRALLPMVCILGVIVAHFCWKFLR